MEAFMKKSDLMWLELALAEDVHNRKHMEYIYMLMAAALTQQTAIACM